MRNYKPLIVYTITIITLALAYAVSPLSRDAIWHLFPGIEQVARVNPVTTAGVFLVASGALAFLAFPSMPMICIAAGFYMGGFEGGGIVLFGSAIGGLAAFLFYRKHIQPPAALLSNRSTLKVWLTLLGLRLSPIAPAPFVNLVAAVFNVSPFQYLSSTAIGSAPLVLFYAQLGQEGHRLFMGGDHNWRQIAFYLVMLILSTLLSALGPWRSILNELKQRKPTTKSAAPSAHSAPGV